MKNLFTLIILIFSLSAYSAEKCQIEDAGEELLANDPKCVYFSGTKAFRNKNYELAAKYWEQIILLTPTSYEHLELKIDALNNLGYLLFYGDGINQNQNKAIEYWEKAASMGHLESEFHLCHGYADRNEQTYNKNRALLHCYKAQLIYQGITNPEDSDKECWK